MKLQQISILVLMGAATLISCSNDLDTTRLERPPLTVGEEIYNEFCNRVASEEIPLDFSGSQTRDACMYGEALKVDSLRLAALHANRQRLVRALDFLLAPPVGADLNELLKNLIPLYDTGEPQAQTRAVSVLLTEVEQSPEALSAMSRFGARVGYRPLELAAGILWPLAAYDGFSDLLTATDNLFGVSGAAHQEWKDVLTATQRELANLEVSALSTEPTIAELTQDLLLSTHPDFTDNVERFVVRRDQRGFAKPEVLESGSWDHRFIDGDGDGFADVDARGQFLDEFGLPNGVEAPFLVALEPDDTMRDARARLLSGTGELVYQYMDTSTTFGAALLQETRGLVREENASTVLDLIHPAKHLLGSQGVQSYSYSSGETLSFNGFNVSESPLLDLAHVVGYVANTDSFYGDLRLAQDIFDKNEREIALVVEALHLVSDWAGEPQYEGLSTKPNNNFSDDLVEVVAEIAEVPGLLESIVDILGSEAIEPLGPYFAKFMRYSDDIRLDPANPNASPDFNYTRLVDRSQPDAGNNISIFQRFLHLIHDTKDAKVCNKEGAVLTAFGITYPLFGDGYAECELLQIDDMSVWYLQSVLGVAEMKFKDPLVDAVSNLGFLLESLSEIDGFTKNPTYQAVNRFVFGERNEFLTNLVDDPMSADGFSLSQRHPDTIFAWEEEAFINAMKPILWKFHEHGREDLYIDLMSAMHLHWASDQNDTTQSSSPQQTAFSNKSSISKFEDLAARMLDEADLLNRVGDLFAVARQANVDGTSGKAILIDTIRQWTVPEWNTQLRGRNGETTTTKTDGATVIPHLAPVWLVFDALRDLDSAFGDDESSRESLSDIIQLLNEQLLQVEEDFGVYQFTNRRGYAMTKTILQFVRERFDAHREADDVSSWTSSLTDRTESTLAHPITAALVGMVDGIVENPQARQELESFLAYLFDELSPNDAFSVTVTSAMDMAQMMADNDEVVPFVNAASVAFDPEEGAIRRVLDFIGKANPYDSTGAAPEFLKRLVSPNLPGQETPLEVIIDVGGQVNRADVSSADSWSAEDIRHILSATREFLEHDSRGLERMYQLIENR